MGELGIRASCEPRCPFEGLSFTQEDEERLTAELEAFMEAAAVPFDEEIESRLDAEFEALKRAGREFSDAIKYGRNAKE